jgi:hypothetical protein
VSEDDIWQQISTAWLRAKIGGDAIHTRAQVIGATADDEHATARVVAATRQGLSARSRQRHDS